MEQLNQLTESVNDLSFDHFKETVLSDYKWACISREVSLLGRKEVLSGKAKFGIFGDGVEVAQVAMAKFFKPGDFRSGYYRDQTFAFAAGVSTVEQFFSQLYADMNLDNDPFSGGRQMNAHFATQNTNEIGNWADLTKIKNVISDLAPTAAQMPKALGLAFASKIFRNNTTLHQYKNLSNKGNEVCFCTIGDASTSEGHFWETINAAGVLQVPLAVFVWDNGYGISVPKEFQTTKSSISDVLEGFKENETHAGFRIYKLKAWNYASLCEHIEEGIDYCRKNHIPVLFHIEEVTQPQGHSTSGSHERYKSKERLDWEREWDGNKKMREWLIKNELCSPDELNEIELSAKHSVKEEKALAWKKYLAPILEMKEGTIAILQRHNSNDEINKIISDLQKNLEPLYKDILKSIHKVAHLTTDINIQKNLLSLYNQNHAPLQNEVSCKLYSENYSAKDVKEIRSEYTDDTLYNGYEIINKYFDNLFTTNDRVIAFGEDVGHIGDVNQGFMGLQEKFGPNRIFDTGIRELTIMGQGIGLAFRGLRPIAEIQYLDYLLYGLQPLSDDVATLHYRTKGQQSCPLIVRTRGHRLEGIWHSGSPLGMMINSLRGVNICVPRNMVQAAAMYNTALQSNDPTIIIECLNGYRLKEKLPNNLYNITIPFGKVETVKIGDDITIVSYGSTLRIVEEAAQLLEKININCEVIDVQTLLPFDINNDIVKSLIKTNRILFVDEDVPGGATAYMYQQVIEYQGGFKYLDAAPATLSAQAHRPSYGSDGDYFSKPSLEIIIDKIKTIVAE